MICHRCDCEAGKDEFCPNCGADLRIFQKAVRMSNVYYNDALQKAQVRNLSGAIVSLQTSLRFYKYNIDARNLLGLVYFELGEAVDALSEWVISKNYQFNDNRASHYLDMVQSNQATLSTIDQTIKKYNQALQYCNQGSKDLAIIQLRKVLTLNPRLVKGHQLMALLYIEQGKLDQAKKSLRNAGRIDTNNTLTLRYLREVNIQLRQSGSRRKQKPDDDLISYQSGNETIIMPKRFKESNLGSSLAYIIIGLIVGIAVSGFLVVPGIRAKAVSDAKANLITANETITANNQTIRSLEEQMDAMQAKLDSAAEDSQQVQLEVDSYEQLLNAYIAHASKKAKEAGEALEKVNIDHLSEYAKGIYDSIQEDINSDYLKEMYKSGYNYYSNGSYEKGIADLKIVTDKDMAYEDGRAAFYLAECYRKNNDMESAKSYFQYVIENYPNTDRARKAQNYLDEENE